MPAAVRPFADTTRADRVHPNDWGHIVMAELVVYRVWSAWLLMAHDGAAALRGAAPPPPPPLPVPLDRKRVAAVSYNGAVSCRIGATLQPLVAGAQGFQWVEFDKEDPKKRHKVRPLRARSRARARARGLAGAPAGALMVRVLVRLPVP